MVRLILEFIEISSVFETQLPENTHLPEETQNTENTRSSYMRKLLYKVTCLKKMHILDSLEYFHPLLRHTLSMRLKYIFYFHNWDLVSITEWIYEK